MYLAEHWCVFLTPCLRELFCNFSLLKNPIALSLSWFSEDDLESIIPRWEKQSEETFPCAYWQLCHSTCTWTHWFYCPSIVLSVLLRKESIPTPLGPVEPPAIFYPQLDFVPKAHLSCSPAYCVFYPLWWLITSTHQHAEIFPILKTETLLSFHNTLQLQSFPAKLLEDYVHCVHPPPSHSIQLTSVRHLFTH